MSVLAEVPGGVPGYRYWIDLGWWETGGGSVPAGCREGVKGGAGNMAVYGDSGPGQGCTLYSALLLLCTVNVALTLPICIHSSRHVRAPSPIVSFCIQKRLLPEKKLSVCTTL